MSRHDSAQPRGSSNSLASGEVSLRLGARCSCRAVTCPNRSQATARLRHWSRSNLVTVRSKPHTPAPSNSRDSAWAGDSRTTRMTRRGPLTHVPSALKDSSAASRNRSSASSTSRSPAAPAPPDSKSVCPAACSRCRDTPLGDSSESTPITVWHRPVGSAAATESSDTSTASAAAANSSGSVTRASARASVSSGKDAPGRAAAAATWPK